MKTWWGAVKHLFQISGGLSSCVHQSCHHPRCTQATLASDIFACLPCIAQRQRTQHAFLRSTGAVLLFLYLVLLIVSEQTLFFTGQVSLKLLIPPAAASRGPGLQVYATSSCW